MGLKDLIHDACRFIKYHKRGIEPTLFKHMRLHSCSVRLAALQGILSGRKSRSGSQ